MQNYVDLDLKSFRKFLFILGFFFNLKRMVFRVTLIIKSRPNKSFLNTYSLASKLREDTDPCLVCRICPFARTFILSWTFCSLTMTRH